jgi:hypothetical protein
MHHVGVGGFEQSLAKVRLGYDYVVGFVDFFEEGLG